MRERRSFWKIHLTRARRACDWYEIPRYYTRKTAAQIASDIRGGRRVAGLKPGDRWLAEWDASDNPDEDHLCVVKVKFGGSNA